jgi:hypothetical protein
MAARVDLPEFGDSWQRLRMQDLGEVDLGLMDAGLVRIMTWCLRRFPGDRPTARQILDSAEMKLSAVENERCMS